MPLSDQFRKALLITGLVLIALDLWWWHHTPPQTPRAAGESSVLSGDSDIRYNNAGTFAPAGPLEIGHCGRFDVNGDFVDGGVCEVPRVEMPSGGPVSYTHLTLPTN